MKKFALIFSCCLFAFAASCGTAPKTAYEKSEQTKMRESGEPEKQEVKDDGIKESGIHNLSNGDRYIGGFKDNKKCGEGEYIYANGDVYEGSVKLGNITGNGRKTTKSAVYTGEFLNGEYHGLGRLTGKNGIVKYGMWHQGRLAKQLPIPENDDTEIEEEGNSDSEETEEPSEDQESEETSENQKIEMAESPKDQE